MSDTSKREQGRADELAEGIVRAALELAVLRHDLCYQNEAPIVVEQCAELVEDTWNAMRGIDTCSEEPVEELTALRAALAYTAKRQDEAPALASARQGVEARLHDLKLLHEIYDEQQKSALESGLFRIADALAAALRSQPAREVRQAPFVPRCDSCGGELSVPTDVCPHCRKSRLASLSGHPHICAAAVPMQVGDKFSVSDNGKQFLAQVIADEALENVAKLLTLDEIARLGHHAAFEFLDMHRNQRTYTWHEVEDALTKASEAIRALATPENAASAIRAMGEKNESSR